VENSQKNVYPRLKQQIFLLSRAPGSRAAGA